MRIKLNQLIAKRHKTVIVAMVAVLSMTGTMEAGAVPDCSRSNNKAAGCPGNIGRQSEGVQNIPEPTTFALVSAGLIGFFGVKRLK